MEQFVCIKAEQIWDGTKISYKFSQPGLLQKSLQCMGMDNCNETSTLAQRDRPLSPEVSSKPAKHDWN